MTDGSIAGSSKARIVLSAVWAIICAYGIYIGAHIVGEQPIPNGVIFGSVIGGVITLANLAFNIVRSKK